MKEVTSILLILLMACCSVFAAEATVELNGTVPEGYVGPGEEEDPIAQNGGLKLIMKVVTSTSAESSDPTSYQDGTDAGTSIANVDIVHDGLAYGVNSLYIAFGAYGNVPKDKTPSLDVTVTSEGWKDSDSASMDGTLYLRADTSEEPNDDKLFTGAAGRTEGVSFSVNTSSDYSGDSRIVKQDKAILVGVSQVTWGLAGNTIPPTGSYAGTITITITGDDGATI